MMMILVIIKMLKDYDDPDHYRLYMSLYRYSPNTWTEDNRYYQDLMFTNRGVYTKYDDVENKEAIRLMSLSGNNFDDENFADYPNLEHLILQGVEPKKCRNIKFLDKLKTLHLMYCLADGDLPSCDTMILTLGKDIVTIIQKIIPLVKRKLFIILPEHAEQSVIDSVIGQINTMDIDIYLFNTWFGNIHDLLHKKVYH